MIRYCRFGLGLALLTAAALACAATWTGGRGPGHRGAYPEITFPENPATVWKAYLGKDFVNIYPSNTVVVDNTVVFAYGRYLFGFSTDVGVYVWHAELTENILGDILLLDGQVIVSHPSGQVAAREPASGKVLWKQELSGSIRNGPTVSDTLLYYAVKDGSIEGIARKTGAFVGQTKVGGKLEAGPLLFGKSMIICYPNGKIIRVDDGIIKWDAELPNALISLTPVTDGTSTVVVNTVNTVYALNPGNTQAPVRWFEIIPDRMPAPVTLDNNRVYLVTRSGRLLSMDLQTGRHFWTRTTVTVTGGKTTRRADNGIELIAPPIDGPLVVGNYLLVRMQSGYLALYHKISGKLAWVYRIKAPKGAPAPTNAFVGDPAVHGSEVYFAGTDGNLYHLSATAPDIDPPVFSFVSPEITDRGFIDPKSFQGVGAIVDDEGSGLQPTAVTIRLDSNDLTPTMRHDPKTGAYYVGANPMAPLEPGMHRLVMTAQDYRGNVGTLALNFILGTKDTGERVPVTIAGEILPRHLKVRPGTIISWTNKSGAPRSIVADTNDETFFSSD
ncbi:MAG TPA: PQQ-binding-like beta-propeller repeat protein, partial [Armatimonadota bacterium]|nr:PQQ-binding-like beta-propeller repeat protein [Armatimonadota bacterium]